MNGAVKSLFVPVVLLLTTFAALCTIAEAHALLVGSNPKDKAVLKAAPKQVSLRFDARIEKSVTQVNLFDGKGKKVALRVPPHGYRAGAPNQLIVPMPKLKPGAYRLEYRVLATDGHLTPGLIRFTVAGGKAP